MELITKYLKLFRKKPVMAVPEAWRAFHESKAQRISVFAGRGTGKSYNIAARAINSKHDCIIYSHSQESTASLNRLIVSLLPEGSIQALIGVPYRKDIVLANGRVIKSRTLTKSVPGVRGEDSKNKEILFNEFDYASFNEVVEYHEYWLRQAKHVVCVGSLMNLNLDAAKSWYRSSEYRELIDSQTRHGESPEIKPSTVRLLLENVPPLGVSI